MSSLLYLSVALIAIGVTMFVAQEFSRYRWKASYYVLMAGLVGVLVFVQGGRWSLWN